MRAPSGLTYTTSSANYPVGAAISANTPKSSGGAVASYAVVPTLPWGLSLNSTSGVISGIPTVAMPQTNYTVTAYNAGGSTSTTLSITVTNGARDVPPSAVPIGMLVLGGLLVSAGMRSGAGDGV